MRSHILRFIPLTLIVPVLLLCIGGPPATAMPPLEDWCCEYQIGDPNLDGKIDITDLSLLIDNQFLTLTPLLCWGEADLDVSYTIDITDIMLYIDYSFLCDGPGPSGSCFFYCPPPPVYGEMLPLTGCKPTETPAASAVDSLPLGSSCVIWDYDGQGLLTLQHYNAGLNCCPVGQAVISVNGGEIEIDETVVDGLCDCICLFDVDLQVFNLPVGEYTIVVREPYWQAPQETFEFTVDLTATPTGMVCDYRDSYPWAD